MQTPALSTPNNIQTGAQSAVLRLTKSHLAQNSKHQPARPPHGARQCKASLHANDWKACSACLLSSLVLHRADARRLCPVSSS
jgi:hypothetical protein